MSDVFIAAGVEAVADAIATRLSWTALTRTWSGTAGGLVWAVSRVDDPVLWAPAFDPNSQTRVLLAGRCAFEPAEWAAAERLPYEGGLAARLILAQWLEAGAEGVERLNGAALVVVIDERTREAHVWTDRMGCFPAFAWTGRGFVMCSHPDVVADALSRTGSAPTFDPISMAEFLQTGMATPPYTYWHGVEQLDAGTRHRFRYGDSHRPVERSRYWLPAYFDTAPIADRREIVDRLTGALRKAVRRRTQARLGPVAVMLSAGADSRAALFSACDPNSVTCYTFYDEPNAELNGARRLAAAAGAAHIALQRDPDYYIRHAAEAVRLSGGMWSIDSAHVGGFTQQILANTPGVLLTGCYADYLFKGLAFNRRNRRLFGRALPVYTLSPFRHQYYLSHIKINNQWKQRVYARLADRFPHAMQTKSDPRHIEYLRIAPLSRESDASGRLLLWRTLPIDPVMVDADVLDVYGLMSVENKLSGVAFGMAVARLVGQAGKRVPNNNYGAPIGANEAVRIAAFLTGSVRRKVTGFRQPYERDPASVATVGSWPYFPRIVERSPRLRDWHASLPPEQAELLFDIVGEERRDWSMSDWAARDPTLLVRLFTASLWISQSEAPLR